MKSCGRAVTAGHGVIADGLIAPTGRKRMLADRQQLDVRVAHLLAVFDQLVGQVAIGQPAVGIVAGPPPTAQVDLVEGQRLLQPVGLPPAGHPLRIVPMDSGSSRSPSRRSAAAPRRRRRRDRTSRTSRRRCGFGTCRASLRSARARTIPRSRWGCACAWDGGGRPNC